MGQRWTALMLVVVLGLATASTGIPVSAQDGTESTCLDCGGEIPAVEYVPDEVLVHFWPAVSKARAAQVVSAEGAEHARDIPALGVQVLRLPPGLSVEEAVARFSRRPEVDYAEPNYILQAVIDDEGMDANQWAPQRIGADQAWVLTSGDPGVVIAIVDTGVDYGHSELSPNMWVNPGETDGNGVDDDGNGFVDDIYGCDYVNYDGDPMDDMYHGTHVAGIAAADDNLNPDGLVGICPDCRLMAVKVLNAQGSGTLDAVANGINYAISKGAKVINLSLGGYVGTATLQNAVDNAWAAGAVVVAAAGNDGIDDLFYPAAYTNAIAVASTDEGDLRSCFSNYSTEQQFINVAAPGEAIYSTEPRDSGIDSYETHSGTSMATPHVSGLAGLLFAQDLANRDNAAVRDLIESTADDLGPEDTDPFFGWGRISAARAVAGGSTPPLPVSGVPATKLTASGYGHTRKLARDAGGKLHLAWHVQEGGFYQVRYATSDDNGVTWSAPEVVFSSTAETYHPALTLDGDFVHLAFPSQDGASTFRTFFRRMEHATGTWHDPVALTEDGYDAVRPDLYLDPTNGWLHMVASSLDNAPYVYYRVSKDQGASWVPPLEEPPQMVDINDPDFSGCVGDTRYATVHAFGSEVWLAGRTMKESCGYFWCTYLYCTQTARSTDGGANWPDEYKEKLASYDAISSAEYGLSLAGVGNRLYLGYEVGSGHGGGLYFRSWDGTWGDTYERLETTGLWPSITQADDGQAWLMWEDDGSLKMRHYDGSNWEPAETVLDAELQPAGYYPNLKLGTGGGRVEWVYTSCKGAPFNLFTGARSVGGDAPPTVRIDAPVEGETVAGLYIVQVHASDDNQVDAVELSIDGGAYQDITGNFDGTHYTYDWDTSIGYPDGTYTLQARATDDAAQTSMLDQVTVEVDNINDPPVASFTYICGGLTCDFDASSSSDADGTIASYEWTFGDGGTGSGVGPSHTYSAGGTYSVQLTVTDDGGETGLTSQGVQVNAPPVAAFSYGCTGLSCTFDAAGSSDADGTIVSYEWTFGDGVTGSGVGPNHTYGAGGTYGVILTVTDNEGAADAEIKNVTVEGGGGQTVHVGDLDGTKTSVKKTWTAAVTIEVHDGSHGLVNGATVTGEWSQGAGGVSSCQVVENGRCAVEKLGIPKNVSSVVFTVTDVSHGDDLYEAGDNHDPDGDSNGTGITVPPPANQPPVATFTHSCMDRTCDFDGSGSYDLDGTINTYAWDYGDGNTGSGMAPSHTYAADGTYAVVLTVTDDFGASGTDGQSVIVGSSGGGTMHVGLLEENGEPARKDRWNATVTITIHDEDHSPLDGASVTGLWSNGTTGLTECTTDGNGQCSVTKANLKTSVGSVVFAVTGVTRGTHSYSPGDNHDPMGDEPSIMVWAP